MGRRRDRTRLLREIREQFRQSVVQEAIEAHQVEQEAPEDSADGDGRATPVGRIMEAVGKRGAPKASTTLELLPGDLVNIIAVHSHKRWTLVPAIVVDGPDRYGDALLMPIGSMEPRRVPARRCRPVE